MTLSRKLIGQWYIVLLYFIMFKMIFSYEKCTLSYIECVIRNVKKERGYIYQFLNGFIELRNNKNVFCFLILYTVLISIKFFKDGGRIKI